MRTPRHARVAYWLACAGLAWGAFAFGAVYAWAYWPLAILCAGSGAAAVYTDGGLRLGRDERRLAAALAAVAAIALLQVVPVPANLLERFSPHRVELLQQFDVRFALFPASNHALSLDAGATVRAVALYASFGLMVLGLGHCLSERRALRLLWTITWLGTALAVAGIIQRPLYAGLIYGFWKPLTAARPFGPFVNKNHFAGWMLMAIPPVLGCMCALIARATTTVRPTVRDWVIWLASRDANQALQAAFAATVMGVALVLTLSRSAMVSLTLALIICGCAAVRRQRGALGRSVVAAGLALSVALTVIWAGTETISARFAAADTIAISGRMPIWRAGLDILKDFWLTGTGLNTYGVATLFYPAVVPGFHLREAHNDYLQLAIEGGLLLCVPILIAIVTFAVIVARRLTASQGSTYWIRLGAVAGLIAVAVQSVVEFSLQMPANAALFATLCALALHPNRPTS